MNTTTFIAALTMGLVGSLHCAGMCGPILLLLPFQFLKGRRKIAAIFAYHLGRISIYALMALILHAFQSFFHPQWQQYISVTMGTILLGIGIYSFLAGSRQLKMPWFDAAKKQSARFFGRFDLGSLFIAGMLNGLLPCGLVYMALSLAATASSSIEAVAVMYAFGIGTMPMLIAIPVLKHKIKILRQPSLHRMIPFAMLLMGCLFLVRGMNLGIPYLSPKMEVVGAHAELHGCCTKKNTSRTIPN